MRIWIIGATGSGKTRLANVLNAELGIHSFHLDDLFWRPGWLQSPAAEFENQIQALAAGDCWIIDGNYLSATAILGQRAQLLIWLDINLARTFYRITKRTFQRIASGEIVCNGNRETLHNAFSRDSLLIYALAKHRRNQKRFMEIWGAFSGGKLRLRDSKHFPATALEAAYKIGKHL